MAVADNTPATLNPGVERHAGNARRLKATTHHGELKSPTAENGDVHAFVLADEVGVNWGRVLPRNHHRQPSRKPIALKVSLMKVRWIGANWKVRGQRGQQAFHSSVARIWREAGNHRACPA